jgi:hypothetical protein
MLYTSAVAIPYMYFANTGKLLCILYSLVTENTTVSKSHEEIVKCLKTSHQVVLECPMRYDTSLSVRAWKPRNISET